MSHDCNDSSNTNSTNSNSTFNADDIIIDPNQPSWIYDQLSYYLTWTWGKVRSKAQPHISTKYTADCVYSDKNTNFEIHLGGLPSLFNEEKLVQNGITHILTAVLGIGSKYSKDKFTTINIPVRDVEWEKLYEHFDTAVDFIKECEKSNGKIYVHCMYGVSRSATLVAAFLIKEKGMSAIEAINYLQLKRNQVDPNPGFRKQLELYEQKVRK